MPYLDEPGPTSASSEDPDGYQAIYDSPEFAELRTRFRRLVVPLVVGFLAWYGLYVVCATYANDFMAKELLGNINVGLVFGLLQFVSTFGIAYFYSKRAAATLDGLGTAIRNRFEAGAS